MREDLPISVMRTCLGALLVGGTALGAGILALPVATAPAGLIPSWVIYFISWLFSIATGLLFVEIGLWMPKGANMVSMATHILGGWGKLVTWALYIFLFYCLTVAYVAEGGRIVTAFFGPLCPYAVGVFSFTLFFGLFVYLGTKVSGRLNGVLMVALIFTYVVFIVLGLRNLQHVNFSIFDWKAAVLGLPIIFTSFSYQGVIPSLLDYLGRNPKKMRIAIIAGTTLPFVAYLIWDFIIKGIIPIEGAHSLLAAKMVGVSAAQPLQALMPGSLICAVVSFFAFFALTTSFIGVTLGLCDFLADALNVPNKGVSRAFLCAAIFIPAVIVVLINPTIFLRALGYAGGFGCALLLGLMPIVMVFIGRYRKRYLSTEGHLFGGKPMLYLLGAFILFEVAVELFVELG